MATLLALATTVSVCVVIRLTIPETAAVVAICAWFIAGPWAIGYAGAITTRMERKADVSIRLASKAAMLYDRADPVIQNASEVLASVRSIIEQLKQHRPEKIMEFIDEIQKSGTLDKVTKSLDEISKRVKGAVAGNLLDQL